MKKDLLKLLDLTGEDILDILDTADQLKAMKKAGIQHPFLAGKTLAMIFEKSSTRTRVSFETGIYQLGGQGIYLSDKDSQIGRHEPVEDTARVLSRFCDGIMIRTFAQEEVETLAKYATIPVINGLTDFCHPCQVLADLMTIREHKGKLEGLKLCYVGDGNNMANSLIVGGLKVGMSVAIACPDTYRPDPEVLAFAEQYPGKFLCTSDILAAAKDADVLYTDVWASMGQEGEFNERKLVFEGYQINDAVMNTAHPGAMVQHCLPAHRGEEITAEVFEAHADEIFDEAENRLHAQKAVMYLLMKDGAKDCAFSQTYRTPPARWIKTLVGGVFFVPLRLCVRLRGGKVAVVSLRCFAFALLLLRGDLVLRLCFGRSLCGGFLSGGAGHGVDHGVVIVEKVAVVLPGVHLVGDVLERALDGFSVLIRGDAAQGAGDRPKDQHTAQRMFFCHRESLLCSGYGATW